MKSSNATIFVAVIAIQLLVSAYFRLTPYLTISLLPALIFCLPAKTGAIANMVIAFAFGLLVDFAADGVIGLNACALLPVAFIKNGISDKIFGKELSVSGEIMSIGKYGISRVILSLAIAQGIFLLIYILIDGGINRPLAFNAIRYASSLIAGTILSIPVAMSLDSRR